MPIYQKLIILFVVLSYMIVSEGERIEHSERLESLELYQTNESVSTGKRVKLVDKRYKKHIHYYNNRPKPEK